MNKNIRIITLFICAIVAKTYAGNDHAPESIAPIREPVVSALHYLFNEEDVGVVKEQADALREREHQRRMRAAKAHIQMLQEAIDKSQDRLKEQENQICKDEKQDMRQIIAQSTRQISNVTAEIADFTTVPVGKYIWKGVSRTVEAMDEEDRKDFVVNAIALITENEDEKIVTKLLDMIMHGRFLEPYIDHPIVRRFLFDMLENEDRKLRARLRLLRSLEMPTAEESDYVQDLIRQGRDDLMDMAIKWELNGEFKQYITSLVENNPQRLIDEPVSIYLHLLVDRDEIPRVEYYDDKYGNVEPPLVSIWIGSFDVSALDLAHTYLASLGNDNSATWLQKRCQKFKVPRTAQPDDAYVYYVLLYIAGYPPDRPIARRIREQDIIY